MKQSKHFKHYLLIVLMTLCCSLSQASEYPSFSFSGTAMLDYDRFDENFLERSSESSDELELRRLRLRFKSDFSEHWRAKLSIDANNGGDVKDAYIQYTAWDVANITIGRQKEAFGLEWLSGSKDLVSIERSISTSALTPSRALGVSVLGNKGKLHWQLGYYQDDNTEKSHAVTGRASWAPWYAKKNLFHVGFAFSERQLKGDEFRINETLEIHSADSLFEGERFDAQHASLLGLELMWQYKGFVAISEWQQSKVQTIDGNEYSYEGGYYQLSYLFSGKNRKYKNGVLDGISTKNDWEVFFKQSQLTLTQENTEAQIWSAGVNYYASKNLQFKANYVRADNMENLTNIPTETATGHAIALRMQYKF